VAVVQEAVLCKKCRELVEHDSLDLFLRWKNATLQMLEMRLSKEILESKSTHRFLTDKQPSSVIKYSRLLHAEVLVQ